MALVGLDNIYVAKLTEENGEITYDTPVRILNAIDAKITPTVDSQNLYADNTVAEILRVFSQVDVEFTIAELSSDHYAMLMGVEKDENGVLVDSAEDEAPYFAFGFRAKKSKGENRLVWLYKGRFTSVDESYQTQSDKADFTTQPIKGTFVKRSDGKWRAKVDTDDQDIPLPVINDWFTKVYDGAVVTP
ncbi:major tail protein [Pseudalkalibacillus sp. JSM 102089]|uniref:major tail protein n=1 Tax=Pseudalkalibacillus sp. JSM 102089 TaxID=3229856 RepID=UPI003525F1B9